MVNSSLYEDSTYDSALAIVGMAGRFPGAPDVQTFWHNIAAGTISIRSFSDEELLAAGVEPEQLADPNYVKAGSTLEGIDQFDASFFGYTPRESEMMDPQHRLFLECCWQALEQAGYDPYTSRAPIGVFAGSAFSLYLRHNLFTQPGLIETIGQLQLDAGNDRDSLASTVSYKLNLKGPAVAVQTFCSTSLVAVHLACQSLLNYESDLALGGGVALNLPYGHGYTYEEGSILSPDGVCRAFDAQAQGSVMGSGMGVVVLKRLREALEEGDQIYAVVRGSAMNNDGSRRVSYTAPGLEGQANVIQAALSYAQVPAESISYIEAHGTGTKLGDAVELEAMRRVFEGKGQPAARPYCALGSVKPNVGHLDRAAGVSGLIKTVQALRHRQLPPSVNYARPNPALEGSSVFYVNTQLREWEAGETPRRAGVSSFGLGGTNVHLVLEEGPQQEARQEEGTWQVLPLSARSPQALQAMRARLATYLREEEEAALGNVAYTLQVGRANFGYRSMVVCRERGEAIALLEQEEEAREAVERRDCPVAWVLPGEEALRLANARDWYEQEASFRQAIDHCADHLRGARGSDLRQALRLTGERGADSTSLTELQAFVIQYALTCSLKSWGVHPQAVLGQGSGEYVAACLSEVLTLESALQLLTTPLEERAALLETLALKAPTVPYISGTTGTRIDRAQAFAAVCVCQTPQTDRLQVALQLLRQENDYFLLEIGSGAALSTQISEQTTLEHARSGLFFALLSQSLEPHAALLTALGRLWLKGVTVDWQALHVQEPRRRIALPTYPFERSRFWIDSPAEINGRQRVAGRQTVEKQEIDDWFYLPTWEQQPLASSKEATSDVLPQSSWLVFLDHCSVGEHIASRLEDAGQRVVRVQAGQEYAQLSDNTYTVRSAEQADYAKLFASLAERNSQPQRILHCWSVSGPDEAQDGRALFQARQETGFYSLLALAKVLETQVYSESIQVLVISNDLQVVSEEDRIRPEKVAILGLCKVIPQENMSVTCRSIDLAWSNAHPEAESRLFEHLLAEVTSDSTDPVVAYRQEKRWVQNYKEAHLEAPAAMPASLRHQGVYLLTGAFGGIGPVLAEYLAKTCQARLILVGHSSLPERENWSSWLETHDTQDRNSRHIRLIQTLEELGSEVLVAQADVADEEHMRQIMLQAGERFGSLHGVIYLAGISHDSAFAPIPNISREECEAHFQPKVYGLYTLEKILQGQDLDFCLLFSSLSSVLGGLGFAGYTAANLFLEAFAQQQNQQGQTPWISVAWDTWQVREEATGVLGATVATYAMSAQEGVEAFTRVLSHQQHRHLVQSTGELEARLRQWVHLEGLRPPQGTGSAAGSRRVPRGRGEVEQAVQEIWQEVLGLPDVGLYENYFDLGGNSLNGLQVMAQLRKLFQVQLPVVTLFEAPTIAALVERILALTRSQPQEAEPASRAEQLRARRKQAGQEHEREGIAIVAMTGRFPGARTVEQFWENLRQGVESITVFAEDELRAAGVPAEVLRQPNYVRARPILPEGVVSAFDAAFFGYSPRDAQLLDPQHRLFLECCWEVLERAGYDPQGAPEQIGVFGGTNISSYLHQLLRSEQVVEEMEGVVNGYQVAISMDKDSLTTAVSYKLNLRGPSLAVQTFCSTSLVAVHLACQSLRRGECDLALAGGVSVHVPVVEGHLYEEGGQESPDGHCRTFDARAGGSMFGDGVGVVVLKRLHEALEDGDQVLAVIRGSAINNDGAGKVSYTAPSVTGQAEVVLDALEDAGVSAESISYVEAHGTATKLGDPIEVAALTKAYRSQTEAVGYCAIGSVKTNVGHLDRAAGVSGLIKTVQALQAEELPASLHYEQPNPEIDFASSPFVVNAALRAWPRQEGSLRRAGINSLGMGGTNVHMIVEEAPPRETSGASREWQLVVLSAKTATALERATHQLGAYLAEHEELPLADVAYTLQVGRSALGYRRMLVCREREEAVKQLCAEGDKPLPMMQQEHRDREVALLLPGVGEQYVGLTRELYDHEPVFREALDQCCRILKPYLGHELREILYEEDPQSAAASAARSVQAGQGPLNLKALLGRQRAAATASTSWERIKQTALAQPAVFALEYALVQLLLHWGLRPRALAGYSLGEYVAACLAGVISLEDVLKLVARRAQMIQELAPGAMIAVALSEKSVQPYLDEQISLAALNGPANCVLAGSIEAIEMLQEQLEELGIIVRRVETTHAFHSSMLETLMEPLTSLVQEIQLKPPTIPYLSNVSGTWITDAEATDATYWARHMCQTVRFSDGIGQLLQETEYVLLEVGPGQSLSAFAKQHPACKNDRLAHILATLPTVYERQSDQASVLTALGKLWLAGVNIEWQRLYDTERRQRVLLPTYPFERQRYWIDFTPESGQTRRVTRARAGKVSNIADWFYLPGWEVSPLTSSQLAERAVAEASTWLLFVDEYGVGERLAARLEQEGHTCVLVRGGTAFLQQDEHHYAIRPGERDDYEALWKSLASAGLMPCKVVHCWSLNQNSALSGNACAFQEQQERGFYSLLFLAQTLGAQIYDEPVQFIVVSDHMQAITDEEVIDPAKATIQAACRVIPQEQLSVTCRCVDFATHSTSLSQRKLTLMVEQLFTECVTNVLDAVVAYRQSQRWVQTYTPLSLEAPGPDDAPFRQQGVYLITGGLGGVGMVVAEHLARTCQAKLVITGRQGLPERREWQSWLEHHQEDDSFSQRMQQIQAIEALGAEVLVLKADAANADEMQAVVTQTVERFGTLHGVIHAAGITSGDGFRLVQDFGRTECELQFQSKVYGLYALEQALADRELDFCLLFSSISTVLGGLGYLGYAAANAFMDAYTYKHNQDAEVPWLCVNWDTWYKEGAHSDRVTTVAEYVMQHEEGLDALARVLHARHLTHIINSTGNLEARIQQWIRLEALTSTADQASTTVSGTARPNLSTAYAPARDEYDQRILDIWQQVLGIEQIGIHDNFFELGGHSLIGTQLITRLRHSFRINLPLLTLFDAPTVAELADAIKQILLEELAQLDEAEAAQLTLSE